MTRPVWSTACPDWEQRIVEGRSLIPFAPLFPEEAKAALEVFNDLKVVDLPGRPKVGEVSRRWTTDFVEAIFGAYDPDSGERLIKFFFQQVAKKNSKSTTAGGMMTTALIRNWRETAELFVLAPTKEVADNSYGPAANMVRADEELGKLLHVQDHKRTITHRNTDATLRIIAADSETVSGKKTCALLVDELWLFGKMSRAEGMLREIIGGLAARPEGFVAFLTTQSDAPPAGVYAQQLEKFRAIRDGKFDDPTSLAQIYEYPQSLLKQEAWRDRKYWHIPNPNLGASVDETFLAIQFAEAERNGKASLINYLAKHQNVQIGQALRANGWAGAEVWERGIDKSLTLETLLERSEVVTMGVDGGGLDDLLGIGLIGRERGTKRWLGWMHAFISDIGMERRKANAEHYDAFEKAGDLTKFKYIAAEPGDTPAQQYAENIRYIVDLAVRCRDLGLLAMAGVDAAGIGAIVDALAEVGITQDAGNLDAVRQGIALMGAIKTLEIKLADGTFKHGGQPMASWCAGNAVVVQTPTAMRIARDESGFGKVDPLMALFNAAHLMSLNPEASGKSFWEAA